MSGWAYHIDGYAPGDDPLFDALLDALPDDAACCEQVGPRTLSIMAEARASPAGQVVIRHTGDREDNARRSAAQRLVRRGLLTAGVIVAGSNRAAGSGRGPSRWHPAEVPRGYAYVYTLTPRGRVCWLRSRKAGTP